MYYWLLIIFFTLLVLVVKLQLNRTVSMLLDRVKNRKRINLGDLDTWMFPKSFVLLLAKINEIIQENELSVMRTKGSKEQVRATLSSIQEAVLVLDYEHRVILYNDAAQKIFKLDETVIGRRVETFISRSRVTSMVKEIMNGGSAQKEEVDILQHGQTWWFEMSATKIPHLQKEDESLVLMVFHDITKIKELENMRKEFVANVSHELRTPITVIKGFAETLVEDLETIDTKRQVKFLGMISKNSERLHHLVEDLLVLSRLESGVDVSLEEKSSLKTILGEVLHNFEQILNTSGVKWHLEMDQKVEELQFHQLRIAQVFENLISNALRYAKGLDHLDIIIRPYQNGVSVDFTDNGCGIPSYALPHIFERFYRVDKGRSSESGGTGLGLSIVKHIVHSFNGEISIDSRKGEGTHIRFTLFPLQSNE